MKIAIFLLAIVLLLWLVFGRRGRRGRRDDAKPPPRRPSAGEAEGMVTCAHCGVHLPRSEAVVDAARPYCSDAHRLAGPRNGS